LPKLTLFQQSTLDFACHRPQIRAASSSFLSQEKPMARVCFVVAVAAAAWLPGLASAQNFVPFAALAGDETPVLLNGAQAGTSVTFPTGILSGRDGLSVSHVPGPVMAFPAQPTAHVATVSTAPLAADQPGAGQ